MDCAQAYITKSIIFHFPKRTEMWQNYKLYITEYRKIKCVRASNIFIVLLENHNKYHNM